MNAQVPPEAFANKVLDPIKHRELILRVQHFADRAGIAPHYLWTPAIKLGEDEIAYYKTCRRGAEKMAGAVYFNRHDIISRMAMVTGAFVRAFLDARMVMVREVVEAAEDGGSIDARILFIPNFYMAHEFGRYEQKKVAALTDVLYSRAARGEPTIIHIDNQQKAETVFGERFAQFLASNYAQLGD